MKKLTAHIFVALLGVTSAGIAHADIASTSYVDKQKTAVETSVTTALSAKADRATTLAGYGIDDAMTAVAITSALGTKANTADLGTLAGKSTIAAADITDGSVTKPKLATDVQTSLGKADTALQAANLTDYAKTVDVNAGLGTKADKATTLAGYGIDDAMTAAAIDTALGTKANTADVTTALELKADKTAIADMQTKTAADTAYAVKGTETVASGAATAATAAAAAAAAAQGDVNSLNAVVTNATTGLAATKTIADAAKAAATTNATTIATKADKATTLAGYGIGDAMTTQQVTTALTAKVNTTDLGALATAAPGNCGDATKKCVLTFNGTAYGWEVVER